MALTDYWPLFDLRVSTPRLELRIPTDDDLVELVELAARGIHAPELMPFTTPWTDAESPEFEHNTLQYHWRARAEFSPESWNLEFVVVLDGEMVGAQGLLSRAFPTMRSAETGSWLGSGHQGLGLGKEMRLAMLCLAFEHLGAAEVVSTAFHDSVASQKVSLSTGYEPNGTSFAMQRDRRVEQHRFRITADRWEQAGPNLEIDVAGLDDCLPMFGL
ncbi:MAG: GNAT family N-acetyltransferase [Actinomycetia bacterium]|nr:GNAT family N-acetyltransferase [Actinomycetes bacterium]MCP4962026.1 GNAT family N-acetyltransferase [Actinomycetes bacterium]